VAGVVTVRGAAFALPDSPVARAVHTGAVLLTLSTTMPQASDLGYLLHKHPDRAQSFDVAVGTAHVVWPEVSAQRSTVAVVLGVDPVALVRPSPRGIR